MNQTRKQVALIAGFLVIMITIFIVIQVVSNKNAAKRNQERLAIVKDLQFKGKVINYKTFQFGGRKSYMICIKLDYSNVKSFYQLNDLCFLKIKNGVATMAVGFLDPYYGIPNYVEVNMNHNGLEKYTYPGGKANDFDLSLANYNLSVNDIKACN